jgi:hypothetical protein
LPVELSSAPGEGLSSGLVILQVGKVPSGVPVGKDVEEAQELPVNPARGRHGTGQKCVGSARSVGVGVTIHATTVRAAFSRSLSTSGSRSCPLRLTSARWLPQSSWMRAASTITCRRSSRLASLMTRSTRPVLSLAFCTEGLLCGNLCRCVDRPESWQTRSDEIGCRNP